MKNAPFNRCVECFDVITNPICSGCLTEQMKQMVGEYNQQLAENINFYPMGGDTICISCGKGTGLCAHCFSKDIYYYLLENDVSLAAEFMARFDFDLRREIVCDW
jgi:hypothetical protein